MKIKVISLWQPWASLMSTNAKKIETRSWATNYLGPLAIHAAKKWNFELHNILQNWKFQSGLAPLVGMPLDLSKEVMANIQKEDLPFGEIVGICNMVDCIPTEKLTSEQIGFERTFGDYSPGRFGWITEDMKKLVRPIPCIGRQGLFNFDLPDDIAKACGLL